MGFADGDEEEANALQLHRPNEDNSYKIHK